MISPIVTHNHGLQIYSHSVNGPNPLEVATPALVSAPLPTFAFSIGQFHNLNKPFFSFTKAATHLNPHSTSKWNEEVASLGEDYA